MRKALRAGRRAVALLAALTLVTILTPASPAAAASTFQAGHLNIYAGLGHEKFLHDLKLITSKADMVALNEVGSRRAFLVDWAADNGWTFYAPTTSVHAAGDALLAKKSMFEVVDKGSKFVCDTNPDEPPPPRYNNWVKYRHKVTGRYVFHINFHANAGIDNNGWPEDLPRTRCAEKQFAEIKELARQKKDDGQVVVSGDLNVDFSADKARGYAKFPWKVFEANELPNLRSSYNLHGVKGTGTHGNRHIDYIYFWKRLESLQVMWMTDYRIVGDTESDHNGVVADFTLAS
ncbi:endonuclease/exonuclease/phosphatase family protein [Micromonospora sp. NPDC005686]|uniref:endonuclease/exonuclease/phosphatase family protein n=1 Tax=unclassified Micromonospora TaxID=2617518 RepID=UPI0033BBF3A0